MDVTRIDQLAAVLTVGEARQLLRLGRNTTHRALLRHAREQMACAIEQAEGRAQRP